MCVHWLSSGGPQFSKWLTLNRVQRLMLGLAIKPALFLPPKLIFWSQPLLGESCTHRRYFGHLDTIFVCCFWLSISLMSTDGWWRPHTSQLCHWLLTDYDVHLCVKGWGWIVGDYGRYLSRLHPEWPSSVASAPYPWSWLTGHRFNQSL